MTILRIKVKKLINGDVINGKYTFSSETKGKTERVMIMACCNAEIIRIAVQIQIPVLYASGLAVFNYPCLTSAMFLL